MSTFSIGLAILFPNPIALEPEICFYSLGTQSKILAKKTKTALLYQKGGFIFEVDWTLQFSNHLLRDFTKYFDTIEEISDHIQTEKILSVQI